jgi:hypothetical protein
LKIVSQGSRPALLITKKGALNKVYQFLAHGRWFSLGTPASSTTKADPHDIAEILLKGVLKHQKSKSNHFWTNIFFSPPKSFFCMFYSTVLYMSS